MNREPENRAVTIGATTIPYRVRRSARRRRSIEISVTRRDGVVVAAPQDATDAEIRAMVAGRTEWILRVTGGDPSPARLVYRSGERVPVHGELLTMDVRAGDGKRATVAQLGASLLVTVPRSALKDGTMEAAEGAVLRWFRLEAKRTVERGVDAWAPRTGATPSRVLIRDQQRRWGSCAPDGTLRFNWRIAMLAPELADAIIVHELCHLRHANHSAAFWALVEEVLPGARSLRPELQTAAARLPL